MGVLKRSFENYMLLEKEGSNAYDLQDTGLMLVCIFNKINLKRDSQSSCSAFFYVNLKITIK